MRYKLILLFCLASFLSFHAVAQSKKTSKKFVLLTYGLPDFARQNASELVQAKWNIQFYFVAGCVVTQELADSVKRENENVLKLT